MIEDISAGAELIVSDQHGVYIPQVFAQRYRDITYPATSKELTDEDWDILLYGGPEHENYWDVWDDVLQYCVLCIEDKEYFLYQDQDLWAIPVSSLPSDDTVFNHTAHVQLWTWLADNPDRDKEDWPGWDYYRRQDNDCFACTVSRALCHEAQSPREYFDVCHRYCPLKWPKNKPCYACKFALQMSPVGGWPRFCQYCPLEWPGGNCIDGGTINWDYVSFPFDFYLYSQWMGLRACPNERAKIAARIRDLPVREFAKTPGLFPDLLSAMKFLYEHWESKQEQYGVMYSDGNATHCIADWDYAYFNDLVENHPAACHYRVTEDGIYGLRDDNSKFVLLTLEGYNA